MKAIISTLAITLVLLGLVLVNPGNIVSKTTDTGTVQVCWDIACIVAPGTTYITLVDEDGGVSYPCVMDGGKCCNFKNLPPGNYHIEYYEKGGPVCVTDSFYLSEGEFRLITICRCW